MSNLKDRLKQFEAKDKEAHKYNTMLTLHSKEKDDSKISFSQQKVMEDWNKQKTVNQNPYEKGYVPSITTDDKKFSLQNDVKREVKTGYSPSSYSPSKTSSSPTTTGGGDKYAELEKLAQLRDRGIITPKEFDLKKKQILGL